MSTMQSGVEPADPVLDVPPMLPGGTGVQRKVTSAWAEILLVSAAILSIVVGTIRWSSQKPAWLDEVFSWSELRDPSLPHLLRSILHGADGGMPVFYITGWLWCHTFGDGVLTLRLYSCFCLCLALVLVWKTLRRYYSVWPAAVGVFGTWCTSTQLLNQCAEVRFYGLYVLAVAATLWATLRLAETEEPSRRLLAIGFACQAVLVLTHILAVIYGVLLVAALITWDWLSGRSFRWKIYLSQAAGWLSLLLWAPGIQALVAIGKPHGWILSPTGLSLIGALNFGLFGPWFRLAGEIRGAAVTFAVLSMCFCVFLFAKLERAIFESFTRKPVAGWSDGPQRALAIFGLFLLTAPLIIFIVSEVVTPIFVPRYMLPSLIGFTILFARYAAGKSGAFKTRKWLYPSLLVFFFITPLVASSLVKGYPGDDPDLEIAAIQAIPRDQGPIVVGNIREFMPLMMYSEPANKERFVYLLDWPSALKEYPAAVTDYHLLLANKRSGYFQDQILFADTFLCSHNKFVILDAPTDGYFDVAIRHDPHYRWSITEVLDKYRYVFAVTQTSPPAACSHP